MGGQHETRRRLKTFAHSSKYFQYFSFMQFQEWAREAAGRNNKWGLILKAFWTEIKEVGCLFKTQEEEEKKRRKEINGQWPAADFAVSCLMHDLVRAKTNNHRHYVRIKVSGLVNSLRISLQRKCGPHEYKHSFVFLPPGPARRSSEQYFQQSVSNILTQALLFIHV